MYAVSKKWAEANEDFLAPEGLIEISCYIPQLQDTLVYTKKDLLSFTHQQTGSLVSGELPKNHIEFTLDNSDNKWNPSNPRGMERYLSERLQIRVRYGYLINGVEEWIPGGVFYLSEWRVSQNGLEASFVARDLLEFMLDKPYVGKISGTLYEVAQSAIAQAQFALGVILGEYTLGSTALGDVVLSDELKKYTFGHVPHEEDDTIAVILQKCANAAGCVLYQNREGTLTIEKHSYKKADYTVPKRLSFTYPETEILRPLKNLVVKRNDSLVWEYPCTNSGEVQTVENDYIRTRSQADMIANWVWHVLRSRQKISGDFRGNPRFDLFDTVNVEAKYNTIMGVVITDIKHTFTGAFRTTFSGYVNDSEARVLIYSGEIYTGEVL